MIIVGGTYDEIVVDPDSSDLVGSGVRAAAALANVASPPELITAVDDHAAAEAELVAEALRVSRPTVLRRTERVGFQYMTPISSPSINGLGARIDGRATAAAGTVLTFGFIESWNAPIEIEADWVVMDPQKPRDTDPLDLKHVIAAKLMIVANRSETLQLGAQAHDLPAAASRLLSDSGATAVISKRGAAGALVTWREDSEIRQENIAAHPTRRVWPIGSGDVFSAGVAFALANGSTAVEAARVGSASAAHWCATRRADLPLEVLNGTWGGPTIEPRPARVYLAGPFFSVAERWLVEVVREELRSLGVEAWSPVHEVGHGDDVAQADLEGLRGCDAVLALLDHSDSGTIFEVGWAVARGVPVVGFGSVVQKEGMKMLGGTAVELHRDLSTACYRAAWAAMGLRTEAGWMT